MTTLVKRSLVLSFSRFASQAIVLVSPMLLVRLLSVAEYGRYREFLLYVALVGAFVTFGVRQSLLYFLPKFPQQERTWISQSVLYSLAFSLVATIVLVLAHDFVTASMSFDFFELFLLYILFFFNLSFLESLWLAKKRTDLVLYISLSRLIIRILTVVAAAYLFGTALAIIYSLIALEVIRCLIVLVYSIKKQWFTLGITPSTLKAQASYFVPLGAGGMVETLNRRAGAAFISALMGAEALAFFAIGSFAIEVVNTLRGAIADVIFPEIVELRHAKAADALPLWQKATVWYCVLLFPVAAVFGFYSETIVTILFTSDYLAAVPVFSAFSLLLAVYCFDFHLPLRVQNANRYFFIGSILSLVVNLALIYPLYVQFGLIGPVLAYVTSQLMLAVFLANRACLIYEVGIGALVHWRQVILVAISVVLALPVLFAGAYSVEHQLLRGILFVPIFLLLYVLALRQFRIWDGFTAVGNVLDKLKPSGSR